MIKQLIAALCLALTLFSAKASDWDDTDKKLFVASQIALAIDWAQTKDIARNPQRFNETNTILGSHPSIGKVNTYFAGAMIGNYLMADYLTGDWRKAYLAGVLAVEVIVTQNNTALGVKIAF